MKGTKRFLFSVGLSSIVCFQLYAQQAKPQLPAGRVFMTSIEAPRENRVTSIEDLVGRVPVIVEADVQGMFPSKVQNAERVTHVETDVLFRVVRVLKGADALQHQQLVVSQRGGKVGDATEIVRGVDPMKLGERYILFLTPSSAQRAASLPVRENLARYDGSIVGTIKVKDGRLQLNKELRSVGGDHEGMSSAQFALAVSRHLPPADRR